MTFNLEKLFTPHAIAVVGASTREGSVGRAVFDNIINSGFKGEVFPVNPKTNKLGRYQCFATLSDIKRKLDLVIIVIPAVLVPSVLREAGQLGIPAAVIISAGFKEAGRSDLETEIAMIARTYNLAVLGPNCLGFINTRLQLNTTFASLDPSAGSLALLSQSGALGTSILDYAQKLGLGFSIFASVGNRAALDEADLLGYLQHDKQTKVIGLYAEQLSRPDKLSLVLDNLNRGKKAKPVIVLKSGKTTAGAHASSSHTGAIAGNDAVYDAFFREHGVIRAQGVADFFDYLQIFNCNQPQVAQNLAIVTNAGGPGVLAADAAVDAGLNLSSLSSKTKKALAKLLPTAASYANPIDLLGDATPGLYRQALRSVGLDSKVQSILVIVTPQNMTEVDALAEVIASWRRLVSKPIAVCLMGSASMQSASSYLRNAGVAVFDYPENAVRALAALNVFACRYASKVVSAPLLSAKAKSRHKVGKIFAQLKQSGLLALAEYQSLPVLAAYGLPVPTFRLLTDDSSAHAASREFNAPVVLKIASADIIHKSEVGGVLLNVSAKDIPAARRQLLAAVKKKQPQAKIEGVLVTTMAVSTGPELIIGAVKDSNLGHALMLGWGGVYTEIIQDAAFALLPISRDKIKLMLASLKIGRVLAGARGFNPSDTAALSDILFKLNLLLHDFPEIKEIDLNPVIVKTKGALILDARIVLS